MCNCVRNYTSFEYDSEYYVYDYINHVTLQVSKNFLGVLNDFESGKIKNTTYENEKNTLLILIDNGLLYSNSIEKDNYLVENDPEIAYLSLAPVYDCNFRCRYCFGKSGTYYIDSPRIFTSELVAKTLDFFFYEAFPHAKKYRIDFVSGGEPLLNFEAIKHIIQYSESFQKSSQKHVSIWLCTNGSLLTDTICQYLDEHNVSLGISIDGDEYHHDYNRLDNNGEGTYSKVVNNYCALKESKHLSSRFKDVWALSVITPINCDLVSILNHHYQLGFSSIQMKIMRDKHSSNGDIEFYNRLNTEIKKLAKYLLKRFKDGDESELWLILNHNDMFD